MGKIKEKLWESKELIVAIFLVLLLLITGSYAWYKYNFRSDTVHIIKAGNLRLVLDDSMSDGILINNAVPVSDKKGLEGKVYTFTLENLGSADANYTLYFDDLALTEEEERMKDSHIKYSLTKNGSSGDPTILSTIGENPNRILETGTIAGKTKNSYTLQVWINKDAKNDVMGTIFYGKIRVVTEKKQDTSTSTINKIVEKAVSYDPTSCVTGEEETCVATTCYENKAVGSCPPGTVLKIKVNDETSKYFYVLHDDGQKITLQQRENTLYNTMWYEVTSDNTKGPLTMLPKLEEATKDWSNVNTQTYIMGTTTFNRTNAFTGCIFDDDGALACTKNIYTLEQRSGKARMITVQEALALGCTGSTQTCPIWMYNYLKQSTQYGGTVDDTHVENGSTFNNGYFTMQAYDYVSPTGKTGAFIVDQGGYLTNSTISLVNFGARAVIEINK